jgi:predicted transcriptional regulator
VALNGRDEQDQNMARRAKELGGGELEAAVMDVLWDRGGWATVAEVHEVLSAERTLSYNTVLTIMGRLHDKGRLERQRDGRAHCYRPLQSREEYAAARMEQVLRETGDRPGALASFVESLADSDRRQLRRILNSLGGSH